MKEYIGIREDIQKFVFDEIVPKYAGFDPAHKEDHALTVIEQAMLLMDSMSAWRAAQNEETASNWQEVPEREMLFIAAACHDLGLVNGRERHHLDSGIIIRNDPRLRQWFTEEDIETIAQAAEDHRASGKSAPRSIYGKIVAEADRVIDGETIIRRTIQFGFTHYPSLDREAHIKRAVEHLREKYGRGGYLKLWIPWSDNATRLNALQEMIADDSAVYREIVRIYDLLQGEA
ncbi:MAG: HD domain-containing protein [Bacteroidales bacterium]|nr:HD domain-containing protein [Bacteroidales bacterium]